MTQADGVRQARRLGVYIDSSFRAEGSGRDGSVYRGYGDFGFMIFACAVGAFFDRWAVIGRATENAAETPNRLPAGIELLPLPYYASLRQVGAVFTVLPRTACAMWRALDDLDAVWVSGAHPIGLLLVVLARLRGRRVILLIRQDTPRYFRTRLPGPAWAPLLLPLRVVDWIFRLLARRMPTTVVGPEIARAYGAPRPNILEMRINLLSRDQLAKEPASGNWSEQVRLLTVGRIESEKNPRLVIEALAQLERSHPGRYSLIWVGTGHLEAELRAHASRLGIESRLDLPGFVPFGPALLERYRSAEAFLHVSVTEGLPQVLYEAMGSGLPIIATDVGGVSEALDDGRAGLIVPPRDLQAVVDAVLRLDSDPELRRRLAGRALRLSEDVTIESQSERAASFIGGAPVDSS